MLAPLTSIVLDGNRLVYICLCVFEKFIINDLIAKIEFYLIATKYKWALVGEKEKIVFYYWARQGFLNLVPTYPRV